jgi:hypothetical protein
MFPDKTAKKEEPLIKNKETGMAKFMPKKKDIFGGE